MEPEAQVEGGVCVERGGEITKNKKRTEVDEQRCALFYGTVRPPSGWDRILAFSKDLGSSTMRFFLFE